MGQRERECIFEAEAVGLEGKIARCGFACQRDNEGRRATLMLLDSSLLEREALAPAGRFLFLFSSRKKDRKEVISMNQYAISVALLNLYFLPITLNQWKISQH